MIFQPAVQNMLCEFQEIDRHMKSRQRSAVLCRANHRVLNPGINLLKKL